MLAFLDIALVCIYFPTLIEYDMYSHLLFPNNICCSVNIEDEDEDARFACHRSIACGVDGATTPLMHILPSYVPL